MLKFMFTLLLCLSTVGAYAQEIKGKVVDSDNKPLKGVATILLDNQSEMVMGAVTDAQGTFSLKRIAPAHYVLKLVLSNYQEQKIAIEMKEGQIDLKTLVLQASSKESKEKKK